jgi:hypothetical protein
VNGRSGRETFALSFVRIEHLRLKVSPCVLSFSSVAEVKTVKFTGQQQWLSLSALRHGRLPYENS